jgi:phosphoglycolate phosphatase-like HAD superfamily hydrolase
MGSVGWLVIDLDGTIVDVRPRHYAAHLRVTTELKLPPVAPTAYWRIKRSRGAIPDRYEGRREEYEKKFLTWIEDDELLKLDCPFPGVLQWLTDARDSGFRVIIATGRRYHDRTRRQLERLAVPHDLLVTAPGAKSAAVTAAIDSPAVAWIGDTEEDIEAAGALRVLAVAVTSGIRSRSFLMRHKPDIIVSHLHQFRVPRGG